MRFSTGTLVVVGIILLGGATAGTALWGRYIAQPGPLEQPVTVVVENGMGPRRIASRLAETGVIAHPDAFVIAVRVMGMDST
ncbi:MAG: hypothetical protein EON60_13040, partial [Alphaproteobacteria bacterium]